MKTLSFVLVVLLGLGGCAAVRSSDADGLPLSSVKFDGRQPILSSDLLDARYEVTALEVVVPETLEVSEANLLYPRGDIVWRGDAPGDRLAQVKSVLDEGLAAGVASIKQGPKVDLLVTLERFHALTEKARYAIGGVHDIVLVLTVMDAETKAVLEGPRRVEISIRAAGNDEAIAEDFDGRTQRVVITEGLTEAIRRELSGPLPAV